MADWLVRVASALHEATVRVLSDLFDHHGMVLGKLWSPQIRPVLCGGRLVLGPAQL